MAVVDRVDAFQRSHRRVGFPLAVLYKFIDDQGSYLAALITYYGFLSIFPLLLLLTSVLGIVLHGDPGLQRTVLDSALKQFPVVGQDIASGELGGHGLGLVVGILGSLYGGLGVAQAGQNAMNVAWAVPRNSRPNPLKARGRSLLLLLTVGLGVIGTTVVSEIGTTASAFGAHLGGVSQVLVLVVSVVLNVGVFWLAFIIATAADPGARALLPGAALAGLCWQGLVSGGGTYVKHVLRSPSASNQTFGVVLGLIAFLYVGAAITVICIEINVVRTKVLYPRSLLTPFTDDVVMTAGDVRAYTDAAMAQRNKGFEDIDVRFRDPDEHPGS